MARTTHQEAQESVLSEPSEQPPSRASARDKTSEIIIKAEDQVWQIVRMIRKAEAFDVVRDLLRDLDSMNEKLRQLERHAPSKKAAMRAQLEAERGAVMAIIGRHMARER